VKAKCPNLHKDNLKVIYYSVSLIQENAMATKRHPSKKVMAKKAKEKKDKTIS
jgi:hypothetical protein